MTAFERQKCVDLLETVNSAISTACGQSRTPFRFIGAPVPPGTDKIKSRKPEISLKASEEFQTLTEPLENVKKTCVGTGHIYLKSITDSILVCENKITRSVHVAEAKNSVLLVSALDSVFLRKVENCIVVVSCHQLRCLDVHDCAIYVQVGNNTMTIEKSYGLQIASLPDLAPVIVDDFNAPLRSVTNPHFDYIDYSLSVPIREWAETAVEDGSLSPHNKRALYKIVMPQPAIG